MFKKQTIDLQWQKVSESTIDVLKRGDRYKLFKFLIELDTKNLAQLRIIYQMFDRLPGLEISKLIFKNVTNDALRKLEQKNVFKTKQELYE